jgi:hypothetical protein
MKHSVLLDDPTQVRYTIRVSCAPTPSSWQWHHPRCNVALLAYVGPEPRISRESYRVRVLHLYQRRYRGSTPNCQINKALLLAQSQLADLERERRNALASLRSELGFSDE